MFRNGKFILDECRSVNACTAGPQRFDRRTIAILSTLSYGFANVAPIAKLAGDFDAAAHRQRAEVVRYGPRVMPAVALAILLVATATMTGMFITQNESRTAA